MFLKRFVLPTVYLFVLAVSSDLIAQDKPESARNSIGLRAGYTSPAGDWHRSPVAPSVDLIGGNLAFEGDLDFAIGRLWTLGVEGSYSSLNGSAWEGYVSGKGGSVSVSGSFLRFALLVRPHIKLGRSYCIRLEFGPALLLASGQETFAGRTYPYDFLQETSFGAQAGIEYIRALDETLALSVKACVLYFPSSVEFAGGAAGSMVFVPITAGIRFLL